MMIFGPSRLPVSALGSRALGRGILQRYPTDFLRLQGRKIRGYTSSSTFFFLRSFRTASNTNAQPQTSPNPFLRAPSPPPSSPNWAPLHNPSSIPRTRTDYSHHWKQRNTDFLYYTASIILVTFAVAYSSVPLYRAICQRTGFGGTPITDTTRFTPEKLIPVTNSRRLRVTFNSSVSDILDWKFVPQQREVRILPGETALAFYTATNRSKEDIIGVATYSVTPGQVAPYFSKIQCFCFEEQKLNAGETVDMPVFFFIDPEFLQDPQMKGIETITLSYTFFKAKYEDGQPRPLG